MWSLLTILDPDSRFGEGRERNDRAAPGPRQPEYSGALPPSGGVTCGSVIGSAANCHLVETRFLFFVILDGSPTGSRADQTRQAGTQLPTVHSIPFLAARLLAQRPPQRRGKTPFPALPSFSVGEPVSRKVGSGSFYVWCRVARGGRCINRSPTLPAFRESISPERPESRPLSPSPQPTGCPERGASLAVSSRIGSPATSVASGPRSAHPLPSGASARTMAIVLSKVSAV